MTQWYIRLRAGNFENGYYHIGNNYDLALNDAIDEFNKDCKAQGFTPIHSHLVLAEQTDI